MLGLLTLLFEEPEYTGPLNVPSPHYLHHSNFHSKENNDWLDLTLIEESVLVPNPKAGILLSLS